MGESRREAITGQCALLIDELSAVESLLRARVPEGLLFARPLGGWSIKEMLGHLADIDRDVFRPRLRALESEANPRFVSYDPDVLVKESGWQDTPLEDILETVRKERRETVALLAVLPDEVWRRVGRTAGGEERDVYGLGADVARHDAHHLRAIALRLHETHISSRADDLPK